MSNKPAILTHEGYKKLNDELEYLKTVKRKEVAEKLKEARGFGDLSENSEYDEAKNEQAEVEARISKLDEILKDAEVVNEDEIDTNSVSIGVKVKVFDYKFDEEIEYTLVGSSEADPFENKVSIDSPIGQKLEKTKVGEEVTVESPGGEYKLKVLEIHR